MAYFKYWGKSIYYEEYRQSEGLDNLKFNNEVENERHS